MQNSIDFQLNMLQPTLAMPTNEDHEVISYWNKRTQFSFQERREDRAEPGGGDVRRAITEYCILPMSKIFLLNESTALTAWYGTNS